MTRGTGRVSSEGGSAGDGRADGSGYGIRVRNAQPLADLVLKHLVSDVRIFGERAALPEKGRPLVHLAAHGPLYAPTPTIAALVRLYMEHGLGNLVVGFYPHRSLFWIPGMRRTFEKLGVPSRAYGMAELAELLRDGRLHVAGTALEGLNCHLSWDEYVGPFRTGGMIAAAILADASICLLAHQGGDAWNIRLDLPFGLTVPLTRGLRGVNIPIGPVRKIRRYGLYCKRYRAGISRRTLERMGARERRAALSIEMETIRKLLNLMIGELREKMKHDWESPGSC